MLLSYLINITNKDIYQQPLCDDNYTYNKKLYMFDNTIRYSYKLLYLYFLNEIVMLTTFKFYQSVNWQLIFSSFFSLRKKKGKLKASENLFMYRPLLSFYILFFFFYRIFFIFWMVYISTSKNLPYCES
jgi:hypothetical protein